MANSEHRLTDSWVSATSTRNYLLRNPLIAWLERYGESKGFVRDTDLTGYDERLEFVPFIMRKGIEFEAAVAKYLASQAPLITIAQSREEIRDPAAATRTFEAMVEGHSVIHQAVLHDKDSLTYGAPDFLIRSDVFDRLFPGLVAPSELGASAPELGQHKWHYIVVDAKFTTLHFLVGGQVGNSGRAPPPTRHSSTCTTAR